MIPYRLGAVRVSVRAYQSDPRPGGRTCRLPSLSFSASPDPGRGFTNTGDRLGRVAQTERKTMAYHESPADRKRWNAEHAKRRTARYRWFMQFATGLGIEPDDLVAKDAVQLGVEARSLI